VILGFDVVVVQVVVEVGHSLGDVGQVDLEFVEFSVGHVDGGLVDAVVCAVRVGIHLLEALEFAGVVACTLELLELVLLFTHLVFHHIELLAAFEEFGFGVGVLGDLALDAVVGAALVDALEGLAVVLHDFLMALGERSVALLFCAQAGHECVLELVVPELELDFSAHAVVFDDFNHVELLQPPVRERDGLGTDVGHCRLAVHLGRLVHRELFQVVLEFVFGVQQEAILPLNLCQKLANFLGLHKLFIFDTLLHPLHDFGVDYDVRYWGSFFWFFFAIFGCWRRI